MKIDNKDWPKFSKRAKKAFNMSFLTVHKPWGTELSFVLPIKDCTSEITELRRMKTNNKLSVQPFGREHEALGRVVLVQKMRMKPFAKIIIRTSIRKVMATKGT